MSSAGEDVVKLEQTYIASGNVKCSSSFGKLGDFYEVRNDLFLQLLGTY